jgi:hypothetical protein
MKTGIVKTLSVLLLGAAASAQAIPVTWTDTIDFTPDIRIPPPHTYFHDISDGPDGFSSFLTGGDDTITGFQLELSLYDDNIGLPIFGWESCGLFCWEWVITGFTPDGTETARVGFGLDGHVYDFSSPSEVYNGNILGVVDIFQDGTLNVSISNRELFNNTYHGDFYLDSSRLTVFGDNGLAAVPAPSVIALLGVGLAGLGFTRRRRRG